MAGGSEVIGLWFYPCTLFYYCLVSFPHMHRFWSPILPLSIWEGLQTFRFTTTVSVTGLCTLGHPPLWNGLLIGRGFHVATLLLLVQKCSFYFVSFDVQRIETLQVLC